MWDRLERTWTRHLEEKHRERQQPLYTQHLIASLNNAYNVMVAQVNKNMEHLTKLLDEARAKRRTMDDCLARNVNDCRMETDDEICKYRLLTQNIQRGQQSPDAPSNSDLSKLAET